MIQWHGSCKGAYAAHIPKKTKTSLGYYQQGIGYTVPAGTSVTEFRKTYRTWEKKLKESGFEDIEYRSDKQTGYFVPFFKKGCASSSFKNDIYDEHRDVYYQCAREFLHKFDFSAQFGEEALTYRTLWRLHSEGVPYRSVAKAFKGENDKRMREVRAVDKRCHKVVSYFWAFVHTHIVLDYFWQWMVKKGYSDPRSRTGVSIYNTKSDNEKARV